MNQEIEDTADAAVAAAAPVVVPPKNGAELMRLLRGTGTGMGKLAIGRKVLFANPRATLTDIAVAFHNALPASSVTLEKIRQLIVHGDYDPRRGKPVASEIEDQITGLPPILPANGSPSTAFPDEYHKPGFAEREVGTAPPPRATYTPPAADASEAVNALAGTTPGSESAKSLSGASAEERARIARERYLASLKADNVITPARTTVPSVADVLSESQRGDTGSVETGSGE